MRASVTAIFAAFVIAAATGPAAADKNMGDLKGDGYSCVRVSVNFIECTKKGGTTYWCTDAGVCEAKARRAVDVDSIRAPTSGVFDPGTSTSPSPRGPMGQARPFAPAVRQ